MMIQTDSDTLDRMANRGRDAQALKQALRARRIQLDKRWRTRAVFVRERGIDSSLDRMITAMETAERTNFDEDTITTVEQLYEWAPGSIKDVWAGGQPTPLEDVNVTDRRDSLRKEIDGLLNQLPMDALSRVHGFISGLLPE